MNHSNLFLILILIVILVFSSASSVLYLIELSVKRKKGEQNLGDIMMKHSKGIFSLIVTILLWILVLNFN